MSCYSNHSNNLKQQNSDFQKHSSREEANLQRKVIKLHKGR